MVPKEKSQGCQSNVRSSHGEKGRDDCTPWIIERSKQGKTKKQNTYAKVTVNLKSPGFLHTDRSG